MFDVASIRKLFPYARKRTYFNAASNGPLPAPAFALQDQYYRKSLMADVGSQTDVFGALDTIRRNGARIFGCKTAEAGFGFNTTFGINLAAFGLPLKPGDEVLLSDVEFPANVYPWLELRRRGIGVKFIKSVDGFFNLENLERSISRKTRVLALSFVQYFNGFKLDVETVAEICRRRNILLVLDAIQGAGCEAMNVRKWNVAIASAGAQKWLLSSQGTGIFYVSEEIQDRLRPPWRSWLGIDWKCQWHNLRRFDLDFFPDSRQYELGTYPGPLVMALNWSLDFIAKLGVRHIQKHNHALLDTLIAYLKQEPFYRITSSLEKKHRSSILSFTSDQTDVARIHQFLAQNNVVTSQREGAIRVASHLYNDRADMDHLITVLDKAARRRLRKRPDL